MSADNKSGKLGEIYAAQFLKKHGYIIIDMNYKTRFSEIDIIARDMKYIVFVEGGEGIGYHDIVSNTDGDNAIGEPSIYEKWTSCPAAKLSCIKAAISSI